MVGSENTTIKTVVEGFSTNVNIQCNINHGNSTIYWIINGQAFDLYDVPQVFKVGYEALTLSRVDRSMNNWVFQCFTIDYNHERNLNLGLITELRVLYSEHNFLIAI